MKNSISKMFVAAAMVALVAIAHSGSSLFAGPFVPTSSTYTLGPFTASGSGPTAAIAETNALSDLWDIVYGPGGIESQLPPGDTIDSIQITSTTYRAPTCSITFLVVVRQGVPIQGPGGPILP